MALKIGNFFTDEFWQGKKTAAGVLTFGAGLALKTFAPSLSDVAQGVMAGGIGLAGAGIYGKLLKSGVLPTPPTKGSDTDKADPTKNQG